jgi:hypothetical protein
VAGEKSFVEALDAYTSKLASARPIKFGRTISAISPGFRITATTPPAKTLSPITEAACTMGNALGMSCGQMRSGTLSSSDCTLSDGSYADIYSFQGTAGQRITIHLDSSAFDAYLVLWDPSGAKVDEDDDGGPGLDSLLTYTLPSTGTWYIGANSLSAGTTGSYTLLLECNDAAECTIANTSCDTQFNASLTTSDCLLDDGSYVDIYRFAGTAGSVVTIDLASDAFDAYLVLLDPDGNVAAVDDDSGPGLDSQIVYTLTKSGNWVVGANSLSAGATGTYSLRIDCTSTNPTCTYSLGATSASFPSAGGNAMVQVTGSPSNCTGNWSSGSNASWITITGGGSGSGSGPSSLSYSVALNASSSQRSGSMTIAGRTFTVTQSGAPTTGCIPSGTRACLLGSRFAATVRYRAGFDNGAADTNAQVKPVTGFANPSFETAFFYFNSDSNIEMLLKMLDQGNTNSAGQRTIAVLFGTATPLRIELTITDTLTGTTKQYTSDFNGMRGVTDFTAFVK